MLELAKVFLTLGATAFGGPAAHIALMQRELVERRQWLDHRTFLELLGVAQLLPGPTSTEVALHIGWRRGRLPGLIVAGVTFIAPAALMVGALAAAYVRFGALPIVESLFRTVQPVVVLVVAQAIVPLARAALTSPIYVGLAMLALLASVIVGEIGALLLCGLVTLLRPGREVAALFVLAGSGAVVLLAQAAAEAPSSVEVAGYFVRVGSLLFGSGYVLLPILHGDLVQRLGWLNERQLLDAIAAGQATPGPLFTTATFVGYLLGGAAGALMATVAVFTPAFVLSAVSSAFHHRVRSMPAARRFLAGVNAASVGLLGVTLVTMARASWVGERSTVIALIAALMLFVFRVNASLVLASAALAAILISAAGF